MLDKPFVSYDGSLLGLPDLMTWWVGQNPDYHGQFWPHGHSMSHGQALHLNQAHQHARSSFFSMVYHCLLQMAWPCSRTLGVYIVTLLSGLP